MSSTSTIVALVLLQLLLFALRTNAQRRSVPIPLAMDRMLSAGREVYDKQSTPTQNQDVPTSVKLAMYIEGIGSFRTHTMDFQLDVYLQQFWKDPRLAHNETNRILIRDKSILNRIWHPDVYFANARIAQFHEVTQPNFLLWIEPDGSILYDTRVSMIVICAMNLKNFPLDSQWCHLRILSYAYDIHHLLIDWVDQAPITKNMNITMSDMDIVKLVPGTCDGNYSTGVWSCVTAEFFVSRELTHHILQTYVPTTLIVVISWFSFWLDVEAVPARVSLAITTLLTLSTQANSVKNSLPEVSYMKSLDLFLAVSVLFVFGVLIEFTIVNYTQRNAKYLLDGSISFDYCDDEEEEEDLYTTMAAAGLLVEEEKAADNRRCALGRWAARALQLSSSTRSGGCWRWWWWPLGANASGKQKLREERQQNHFVVVNTKQQNNNVNINNAKHYFGNNANSDEWSPSPSSRLAMFRRRILSRRDAAGDNDQCSDERFSLVSNQNNTTNTNMNNNNNNNLVVDIERGRPATTTTMKNNNNNNNFIGNDNSRCWRNKKILALENRQHHQLQYVPMPIAGNDGAAARSGNGGNTVAPIIACGDAEDADQRGTSAPHVGACDQREAARIRYWANPELSCEELALRARGGDQQFISDGNAALPTVIVETEAADQFDQDVPSSPPPPMARHESASALVVPSSDVAYGEAATRPLSPRRSAPRSPAPLDALLGPRPPKPLLRRASALASLLDPISIGRGSLSSEQNQHQRQPQQNANAVAGGGDSPGASKAATHSATPTMSTQSKWRHAVRKLQMNKREAGRIQAKKIDAWSRWAFPLSYLSFQLIYWYYYLRLAQ